MVKKRRKKQLRLLQLFIICADHWFQDVEHLVGFLKFFFTKDSSFFLKFLHEKERKKWDFTLPMSPLSYYLYHTVLIL